MLNMNLINVLNPDQTPMDVSDQPVYASLKELKFRYPDIFGDYIPLMGALHIEHSLLVIHGYGLIMVWWKFWVSINSPPTLLCSDNIVYFIHH